VQGVKIVYSRFADSFFPEREVSWKTMLGRHFSESDHAGMVSLTAVDAKVYLNSRLLLLHRFAGDRTVFGYTWQRSTLINVQKWRGRHFEQI